MVATAITPKGTSDFKGGSFEFGTFVLDAASIAAAEQGVETAAITCSVGDIVFVNARAMGTTLAIVGASVTDTNEVSIYINNTIDSTTAVNPASLTFDYLLIRLS